MRYNSKYYTPENFTPKFLKLLDKKYADLKKHKRRSTFDKDYFNLFHRDITEMRKHWCTYRQKPSIESLINICELLDCDIDYFLTEQEDFKKDITSASEITGLEHETIEKILKLDTLSISVLNEVIQHADLINLLHAIHGYIEVENYKYATLNPTAKVDMQTRVTKEYFKYPASTIWSRILDDIYNNHNKN